MLLSLAAWLQGQFPEWGFLRLFQYLTFRAVMAAMMGMFMGWAFGPWVIKKLMELKIGQPIRSYGIQEHLAKSGTPTMGGVLILISITISVLLWANLENKYIWVVLFVMLGFGAIGWLDDWMKVVRKDPEGMRSRDKYLRQSAVGFIAALCLVYIFSKQVDAENIFSLMVPFFKTVSYPLGIAGFLVLSYLVIVGTSNAVNLTDGLDGLAIMPVAMVGAVLGIFAYIAGHVGFSHYLFLPYVPGAGELMIFCAAMGGAALAFLWFNCYPAQVFMGDVGALALGGALGTIAVIVRQEIVLAIIGGVFVAEALSVMLQVVYFKWTKKRYGQGRRLLKMAPLHHHFEKSGWKETQVVIRFWILTILLCLIGLSTLKLR